VTEVAGLALLSSLPRSTFLAVVLFLYRLPLLFLFLHTLFPIYRLIVPCDFSLGGLETHQKLWRQKFTLQLDTLPPGSKSLSLHCLSVVFWRFPILLFAIP
jgi:hypothetical protein